MVAPGIDELGANCRCRPRHIERAVVVHGFAIVGMGLAIAGVGKRRKVDDGFGGVVHEQSLDALLVGNVELSTVERNDLMGESKKPSGAATNKAGSARDEYLHCGEKQDKWRSAHRRLRRWNGTMRNVCTKIRRKAEGSKRTDTKNAPHGASNAGTMRGTRERRKIGQGANRVDFPRIVVV